VIGFFAVALLYTPHHECGNASPRSHTGSDVQRPRAPTLARGMRGLPVNGAKGSVPAREGRNHESHRTHRAHLQCWIEHHGICTGSTGQHSPRRQPRSRAARFSAAARTRTDTRQSAAGLDPARCSTAGAGTSARERAATAQRPPFADTDATGPAARHDATQQPHTSSGSAAATGQHVTAAWQRAAATASAATSGDLTTSRPPRRPS